MTRRVAVDLAVMLADGGEAIADLAVLRTRASCSARHRTRLPGGSSAPWTPRPWLASVEPGPREVAWAQAAETGRMLYSTVGGFTIPGFVLDIDATIVVCHSGLQGRAEH